MNQMTWDQENAALWLNAYISRFGLGAVVVLVLMLIPILFLSLSYFLRERG